MLPLVSPGRVHVPPIRGATTDERRSILGCYPLSGEILRPGVEQPGIENPHEDSTACLTNIAGGTERRNGDIDRVLIPGAKASGEVSDVHQVGVRRNVDELVYCGSPHEAKRAD